MKNTIIFILSLLVISMGFIIYKTPEKIVYVNLENGVPRSETDSLIFSILSDNKELADELEKSKAIITNYELELKKIKDKDYE